MKKYRYISKNKLLYILCYFLFVLITFLTFPTFAQTLSVNITGLDKEMLEQVLPHLSIKQAENEEHLNEERLQILYQESLRELSSILEAYGYYHAEIESNLKFCQEHQDFKAEYHVHLGQGIRIRSIEIRIEGSGQHHEPILEQLYRCPFKVGNIIRHDTYDKFKQELLAETLQQGYLDAVYTKSSVRVDIDDYVADICLVLLTGNRYTFGEVQFLNPPYPTSFLNRYIPFCANEPYTTERLLYFQRILTEANLFDKVRIDPLLNDCENLQIPLKVRLNPKPHNRYTASIGYGTDTGWRTMAGLERKRLHYPGHKIHVNGKVSEKRNQVNLEYSLPGEKPATDTIRMTARVIEEKFYKKYSLRTKVGASYNMNLFYNIEQILSIHYLSEVNRILPTDPKTQNHFLMPSIGYVWSDMRKTISLLPYGTRISLTVRGGLDLLLSTTNMIQTDCRIKSILPLNDISRLILRNDFGVISAGNRDQIPLSLRYFTGGDQTIRGYGYRSLGPVEEDAYGEPIVVGGKYLFVVSAEIDRVIYKNISLAAFVDTGNAMNKLSARLATGVGLGLRWGTPLGPLRFDFAQGLNNKKFKPRIHITFGMDF